MLRKALIILFSCFISQMSWLAHGTWQQYADDMYKVFGFERDKELTDWMRFVSSVLIDNNKSYYAFSNDDKPFNFYAYLQEKHPDFQYKHRLLFHWGYNSRPLSTYHQNKVTNFKRKKDTIKKCWRIWNNYNSFLDIVRNTFRTPLQKISINN